MNWLDIVIAIIVVISALIGWRIGFVNAAVTVIGVFIAVVVGAHVSGPIADALTDSVDSESVAAIAAYVIVGVGVFIAVQIAGRILTEFLEAIFLGWLNDLGGLVLGAAAGFLAGAVLIAILARLAFLTSPSPIEELRRVEVREGVKNGLMDSSVVPAYLDAYDRVPARALGMTPGEFHKALMELKRGRAAENI